MSCSFGENIKFTIFGQSHSEVIGALADGLPCGELIDENEIAEFMKRRAPGQDELSTPRKEKDVPKIISGLADGKTCGAPLCAIIENTDTRSGDYSSIADTPRPSHADYSAFMKYGGKNDARGGGNFSGRMTAPLCFIGSVCKQILKRRGIFVSAHILSIHGVYDDRYDPLGVPRDTSGFPVICAEKGELMRKEILNAKQHGDSVGGEIECMITGVPPGIGEPIFGGIENRLSSALFGIPAVKGIQFGSGFSSASMTGSEHNDAFYAENGVIKTKTNNHGGILGGISSGMPIVFSLAIKPTPSIAKEQDTVKLSDKTNTTITIGGRHDPCIVPRAVACVEAVAAAVILDLI